MSNRTMINKINKILNKQNSILNDLILEPSNEIWSCKHSIPDPDDKSGTGIGRLPITRRTTMPKGMYKKL